MNAPMKFFKNKRPTNEEFKQACVAAFAMGVVITSAYFILFVLKQ
jgi:hypothetical protein